MRSLRFATALGLGLLPAAALVGTGIAMAGGGSGLTLLASLDGQGRSVPAGSTHSLRVTLSDVPGEASLRDILITAVDPDPTSYTAVCDGGTNGSMSLEPEGSLHCTFQIPARAGNRSVVVTATAHVPGQSAAMVRTQTVHYTGTTPPPPPPPPPAPVVAPAPAPAPAAPKLALLPPAPAVAASVEGAGTGTGPRANVPPAVQPQPVMPPPPVAAAPAPVIAPPAAAPAPAAAAVPGAVPPPAAAPVPAVAPVPAAAPVPAIVPPMAAAPIPNPTGCSSATGTGGSGSGAMTSGSATSCAPTCATSASGSGATRSSMTADGSACKPTCSTSTSTSASAGSGSGSEVSGTSCGHGPARLAHTGSSDVELGEAAALATLLGLLCIRFGRTPAGWATRNMRVFGSLPTYPLQ